MDILDVFDSADRIDRSLNHFIFISRMEEIQRQVLEVEPRKQEVDHKGDQTYDSDLKQGIPHCAVLEIAQILEKGAGHCGQRRGAVVAVAEIDVHRVEDTKEKTHVKNMEQIQQRAEQQQHDLKRKQGSAEDRYDGDHDVEHPHAASFQPVGLQCLERQQQSRNRKEVDDIVRSDEAAAHAGKRSGFVLCGPDVDIAGDIGARHRDPGSAVGAVPERLADHRAEIQNAEDPLQHAVEDQIHRVCRIA